MNGENDGGNTTDKSTTFSDTEHDEHDEGAFLTPQNEVEGPSTRQEGIKAEGPPEPNKDTMASCTLAQVPAPRLEIQSPRPSPHVSRKHFMTATVEDWEEDECHDRPSYNPRASSCVTPTPLPEASLRPPVQDKSVKTVKSEVYLQDHRDELHQRRIELLDTPVQQGAQQNTSRRLPSVMDYLVSDGPVNYPMSTPRASSSASRRAASEGQPWQHNDHRLPTHWGQPHAVPGYQAEERKQQHGWQFSPRPVGKPFNVHDGCALEKVLQNKSFSQPFDQSRPPAPPSTIGVFNNDVHADILPGQGYYDGLDSLPLSGYHLLATRLSGDSCGQPISPIYRRFDALHHRLLLYMQDEICELERQLISLEARDTFKRSYAGGVIPASRREDRFTNSSLAQQKTEILGHIGYKLSQYNQVLASFCKVQDISAPTWQDIHMYKSYLSTSKLIVDDETRFLDASNDLISLNSQMLNMDDCHSTAGAQTPMVKAAEEEECHSLSRVNGNSTCTLLGRGATRKTDDALFVRLALSGTMIVLVPILIFSVIPSFVGRIAIVLLVALGVAIIVDQLGLLPEVERHRRDWIVYFGLYCAAMAVVAGAVD